MTTEVSAVVFICERNYMMCTNENVTG